MSDSGSSGVTFWGGAWSSNIKAWQKGALAGVGFGISIVHSAPTQTSKRLWGGVFWSLYLLKLRQGGIWWKPDIFCGRVYAVLDGSDMSFMPSIYIDSNS